MNSITVLEEVIEDLLGDYVRSEQSLTIERVEQLLIKRNLKPKDCATIFNSLHKYGIELKSTEDFKNQIKRKTSLHSAQNLSNSLTREEEKNLIQTITFGRLVLQNSYPGKEDQFSSMISKRTNQAKTKMITHNLGLVAKIAREYENNSSLELDDLIQEGVLGLIKAIDKFDPSLGNKFSTYAWHWIRQSISRAIINKSSLIRVPANTLKDIRMLNKACIILKNTNPLKTPGIPELADELNWPEEKIEFIKALVATELISLEYPVKPNSKATIQELIPSDIDSPEDTLIKKTRTNATTSALMRLKQKERDIILLRFGFDQERDPYTLEEIGECFGVSRERIRQIETKALTKLGSLSRKNPLRDYRLS